MELTPMERFLVASPKDEQSYVEAMHRMPAVLGRNDQAESAHLRINTAKTLAAEVGGRSWLLGSEKSRNAHRGAGAPAPQTAERSWLNLDGSEDSSDDASTIRQDQLRANVYTSNSAHTV